MNKNIVRDGEGGQGAWPLSAVASKPPAGLFVGPRKRSGKLGGDNRKHGFKDLSKG